MNSLVAGPGAFLYHDDKRLPVPFGASIQNLGEPSMPSFTQYMAQYDHEHTNPWNKILHGIGIPMVLAGIVLFILTFWRAELASFFGGWVLASWQIGIALFVAGWILLFAGHRIEGNRPAFFQGVIYFLVGPVWIAKEMKDALLGARYRVPRKR